MNHKTASTAPAGEWIRQFAARHIGRFPRDDWPEAQKAKMLWDGWMLALNARKATEAEAEAASIRLMADPPEYIDRHLGKLLEIIERNRNTQQNYNPPGPKESPMTPEDQAIVHQIVTTPFWWREMGKPESAQRSLTLTASKK